MTKGGDAKLLHLVRKYCKDEIREADDLLTCICTNHREYQRRNPSKLKMAIAAILQEEEYDRAALERDQRSMESSSLNASLCSRYSQLPQTQEASSTTTPTADPADDDHTNSHKKPRTAEQEASRKRRKLRRALLSETAAASCDFRVEKRPTERFQDLGGLNELIETIRQLVITPLRRPELYRHLGIEPPRGILLRGPPGCGKTHLANAIAGELDIPFFKISAPELVSGMSGESESRIREVFAAASSLAPSLMFIDEIDAVAPKRDGDSSRGMEKRMVAQLLTCLDGLNPVNNRNQCAVMVLAATNRPDSLDPALRRAGRFDKELLLGVPEESARMSMLQTMTSAMRAEVLDFSLLAKRTPGFVGADLKSLAKEAANIAIQRIVQSMDDNDEDFTTVPAPLMTEEQLEPLNISMDDFLTAIPLVQPSSKREGFATVPGVTWDDIGALQPIREELHSSVLEPIRNPEKFHQLGLPLPAGVLLFGPPGCGKTLLAKAIANESGANFISVKGPELLDKYVGESEKAVRVVFERARSSSPCIIFFDELDSLVPRRGSDHGGSGVSERVVNQLLTEMDGLNSRRSVFVMAATNRPELIDPAMLRPGRLDKLLYVPLPTAPERVSILRALAAKVSLAGDVDLETIGNSDRAEGYSGADCAALLREAGLAVMKQNSRDAGVPLSITARHFELAFNAVIPSVSKKDQARYDRMRDKMAKARTRDATTLVNEVTEPENAKSDAE